MVLAHQAPLSMGLYQQEYWNGLPFPSPRDLPDLGIEFASPTMTEGFFAPEPPGKHDNYVANFFKHVIFSGNIILTENTCWGRHC